MLLLFNGMLFKQNRKIYVFFLTLFNSRAADFSADVSADAVNFNYNSFMENLKEIRTNMSS